MLVIRQAPHPERWKIFSLLPHSRRPRDAQDLEEYIRGANRRMIKAFALAGGLGLLLTALLLGLAQLSH
jgi:hypothetical protein